MSAPLKILIIEDRVEDAELMVHELRQAGFDPDWRRVETEPECLAQLKKSPECILADHTLPQFGAARVLELLKEQGLDIPCIVVTGSISEEVAVERLKQGAADYILKDRMTRLGEAVRRALEEKRLRDEKQRVDQALRESEQRFREIAGNINEVFFSAGPNGSPFYYVSPVYEQIMGQPAEELYQNPHAWLERVHPVDRPRMEAVYNNFENLDEEYRVLGSDGTIHWVRLRTFPVKDSDGRTGRIVGTVRDITTPKMAEDRIKAHNKELETLHQIGQSLLNNLDLKKVAEDTLEKTIAVGHFDVGAIELMDFQSNVLQTITERGLRNAGSLARRQRTNRVDAEAGRTVRRLRTLDELRPRVDEDLLQGEHMRRFKKDGVRTVVTIPIVVEDKPIGLIRLGTRTLRKFTTEEINLFQAIANQTGIAIQKIRLYEEVQKNLERIQALREIDLAINSTLDLRTILDFLLEKIEIFLPTPSVTTVRLFNKVNGVLELVACRNINEAVWKAGEGEAGRGLANAVFETKASLMVSDVQSDPRTRDPSLFKRYGLVSYLGVPLVAKKEILGVLGFYSKVEHLFSDKDVEFLTTIGGQAAIAINNAQLYEQMVKSNQVKDDFLSIMSHELRTPLNVVMGYTAMIKDGLMGEINPHQEEALQKITDQANDQLAMINNVLYATVLEVQKPGVDAQEMSPAEFLDQLRTTYDDRLQPEGLILRWDYPRDLPLVQTDWAKLRVVLQNLIGNAIKFTGTGTVTVSALVYQIGGSSNWVEFKVADTGVGISEEQLPFIFEKFQQADTSQTRTYGGAGMGLYIGKKFTELLGGTVEVETEPGKGSTFTVKIPAPGLIAIPPKIPGAGGTS